MILQCEKCLKRFMVPTHLLGEKGRKVRCAGCAHTWFQVPMPEATEERIIKVPVPIVDASGSINPTPPPVPEHSSLPVPSKEPKNPKPLPGWLWYAAGITIALNCMLGALVYHRTLATVPFLAPVYKMVGLESAKGFGFNNVTYNFENNKGKTVIKGVIYNTTSETVVLEPVRLSVLNVERKIIGQKVFNDLKGIKLKSHTSYDFEIPIETLSDRVKYIVLDIGQPFELALR